MSADRDKHIPDHWTENTWEDKARENPLHAIMTVPEFRGMTLEDLRRGIPTEFLSKGRTIYDRLVASFLTEEERSRTLSMFDYGCGIGRIMRAAIDAGHKASGADISQTMLDNCPVVVPDAENLFLVKEDGSIDAPDGIFDVAYSFAVVQHISSLRLHQKAISEMARLVKPGGLLAIQVNCEDYSMNGAEPGWTMNYEDFSVHFEWRSIAPVRCHPQNNWSGVYIGRDLLITHLNAAGFAVENIWPWTEAKPRAMVFVARKTGAPGAERARELPGASGLDAEMVRELIAQYATRDIQVQNLGKLLRESKERAARFKAEAQQARDALKANRNS